MYLSIHYFRNSIVTYVIVQRGVCLATDRDDILIEISNKNTSKDYITIVVDYPTQF